MWLAVAYDLFEELLMIEELASMAAGALSEYFTSHRTSKIRVFFVSFLVFTIPILLYGFFTPSVHGTVSDIFAGLMFGLFIASALTLIIVCYEQWQKRKKRIKAANS